MYYYYYYYYHIGQPFIFGYPVSDRGSIGR